MNDTLLHTLSLTDILPIEKPMSLIVHHLNNSRSQRILWLLEEIGADYEIRYYDRDPVTNLAPPELLAVHPLGKSPLIEESGDSASGGRGRVIIERSEEQTSELPSLMRISYAVFCVK